MKLFQFAVASIVDANTGYANTEYEYPHNRDRIDYDAEIRNSRNIRSKSIVHFLKSIAQQIATSVDRYQARLQQRRNLDQLHRLNSHLLRDIGLTNEDLGSVVRGEISLQQLNTKRRDDLAINGKQTTVKTIAASQTLPASNQDNFSEVKCA